MLTNLARGNQLNKGLAGEGMGGSQSRRERAFNAAGCAAVTGLAKKRKGKEGVGWWLWLWLSNSLPALPLASCGLCSPSLSHYQAVGCLPGKDWAGGAPRVCCGGCCGGGGGVPGGKMQLGGEGWGRTWSKVCTGKGWTGRYAGWGEGRWRWLRWEL